MPRLPEVSRDEAAPSVQAIYHYIFGDHDPVAEPGGPGGTPGNWWTVFAQSPDVLSHAVAGFALYRSPTRVIDPRLRELGMTRAGWCRGSHFVFSQHCKSCREVGISEEQIAAIPSWSVATCFSPVERAVLAYTDALVLEAGRVPDSTFAALASHLDPAQILELTYLTMMYEMHAVISKALRLEFDDRDDPIVEVAGPPIVPAAER